MAEPQTASDITAWERDAQGRVRVGFGGDIVPKDIGASDGALSRRGFLMSLDSGHAVCVGLTKGGAFTGVTPAYVSAAAPTKKCILVVRLRIRANVKTAASGVDMGGPVLALPDTAADKAAKRNTQAVAWLDGGERITPAIQVGSTVIPLCDEFTAVTRGPGEKCELKFWISLWADVDEPQEPEHASLGVTP